MGVWREKPLLFEQKNTQHGIVYNSKKGNKTFINIKLD